MFLNIKILINIVMDAIGKESSNDSSKCSLYNDDHTETSRTVIKESDKNLAHLSVKSQELIGTEQTSAIINGWLSKRQRLTIENSWKRATKVEGITHFFIKLIEN